MKFTLVIFIISQSVLDVGIKYLQNKDYEKAYQIFQQIVTVSKDTPEGKWAKYYLSVALLYLGDTLSSIGNLTTLWKENYEDSLAYLTYKKLTELSTNRNDSLKWTIELLQYFPLFGKRKELIESTVSDNLNDSLRIILRKILASDYKSKRYLYSFGTDLLSQEPGKSLIIAEREGFPFLKIKALIKSGKYLQAYINLLKNNPDKKIPQEAITFVRKSGNSTRLIGILYPLDPEDEKTSFEFARILEEKGLSTSKFKKALKNPLYTAYFNLKNLTLPDLQQLENFESSNLKNYLLAKGYLKEGYLLKSLQLAFLLPDSAEYNRFKLELVDTLISRGIFTKEMLDLLSQIEYYYPITERDERMLVISKALKTEWKDIAGKLEANDATIKHKIPINLDNTSMPDTEVIKILYENFDFGGVIRFSSGKILPSSMRHYIASALIEKGVYDEAVNLLESEKESFPTLYLKALTKLKDPSPYLNDLPKKLKNTDAYYLYLIAVKTKNSSLLDNYNTPYFNFYRAILKNNVDSALQFVDVNDVRMLLELSKLLFNEGQYEKIVWLTQNVNPLYPVEAQIYKIRLKALFSLGEYNELIKEYENFSDLIGDEELSTLAALSASKLNNPDLAFLFALRSDNDENKKLLSRLFLYNGFAEEVDTQYLEGKDLLYYNLVKKDERRLLEFPPKDSEEAWIKLKYLAEISKKALVDSLFQIYASNYNFTDDVRLILKSYLLLAKNEIDSLLQILNSNNIQDPEILYLTGVKLIQAGRVDEASNLFKSACDFADDSLKHELYFRLGNIEATKGNFNSALFYYTKALNLGSKYRKEIYYNLSISFKNTGQLDSAFAYLEKLINEYPDDEISIEASINLGFQLVDKQVNPDKAIKVLEGIIGVGTKTQDCEALYWLSRAYMLTQDLKMALATLKRIYTYYNEFPDWRDTAKLDAAKILIYFNYKDMAKNLYNDIIKTRGQNDPLSQEALNQMEFFKL
jgi:tetratricopeptide (TPR) repeat protein